MLPGVPFLPGHLEIDSVFFTNADEITANIHLKEKTFNFHGTSAWFEVGLQVLAASGWRPDCVIAEAVNVQKTLPPRMREESPLIVGNCDALSWITGSTAEWVYQTQMLKNLTWKPLVFITRGMGSHVHTYALRKEECVHKVGFLGGIMLQLCRSMDGNFHFYMPCH